jgi:hypothetical protein
MVLQREPRPFPSSAYSILLLKLTVLRGIMFSPTLILVLSILVTGALYIYLYVGAREKHLPPGMSQSPLRLETT